MFIYKIENKINGKLYVGKTQKSLEERFTGHKERARAKYNCHLYDSMNHYGFVNFEIKIIEECKTEDELNEREIYWIKFLKTLDRKKGYNMTIGGTGGDTFSNQSEERKKERLEKQKVSMIGKNKDKKRTKAEKENLRVINTGKKASTATKEKMRKSQEIAQNRLEVKKKKSEAMKGKKHTKETIEKIRVGNLGKKHKKKQHIFCIGDVHGAYRALKQVLKRASFDYEKDKLIFLGDVADGWTETAECLEELLKIKKLVFVRGNHDCLSEDTECLTKTGWKKYIELSKSDLIFSLDTKTGLGKWDKINEIIVKDVSKLKNISNRHIDLMCTESHRVLTKKRVRRQKKQQWLDFSYTTAKEIKGRHKIPVSAVNGNLKELPLSDFEIKISAWILTDGGLERRKENHTGQYKIYQSKYVDYLKELLDSSDYTYNLSSRKRNITHIMGKRLKTEPLEAFVFSFTRETNLKIKKYLPEKYPFPVSLYDLSKRQFDIFLKEVLLADGSVYTKGGREKCCIVYGTFKFLSNLQALCVTNGYRATLTTDTRGAYRLNISEFSSTQLDINKKTTTQINNGQRVWCLSVPMTNFMVRRNGKSFFTGNSWLKEWLKEGKEPRIWTMQGGQNTILSYMKNPELKGKHLDFLKKTPFHYLDKQNRLFVHGGIDLTLPLEKQDKMFMMWDRHLVNEYLYDIIPENKYKEIYLGHTSIYKWSEVPVIHGDIIYMDTGGGWEGVLSMMNINTKEIFQSDKVTSLYPEVTGHN